MPARPTIEVHPSSGGDTLERSAIESLRANRVDPKCLYVTARQAELWRKVFLRHSPIHGNPEFVRIYRDAFARTTERLPPGKIALTGLGCGTGVKEFELHSTLKARGHEVLFSAVDVSRDLVEESRQRLAAAGAGDGGSLVCDLAETEFLAAWLNRRGGDLPRIITFFGLVPNLAPSVVTRLFRSILRSGDVLLVSAHLAPMGGGVGLSAAMRVVLPQYDNVETLAWLTAALEEAGFGNLVDAPEMKVGEVEGMPALVASARWKSSTPFEKWGCRFTPRREEPLRLFYSLRYTPPLFEDLLRQAGLGAELLSITACRQEAIWAVTGCA